MLRTRLWVGTLLVVLAGGGLWLDQYWEPFYPVLLLLMLGLLLLAWAELVHLLPGTWRPSRWLWQAGLAGVVLANWLPHMPFLGPLRPTCWEWLAGVLAAFVLAALVSEMARFREPGLSTARIASAVWLIMYLGLLPTFLVQLRWRGENKEGLMALLLAIFVPKACDIGAYCTGRLIGRHPMTPVLSPKKTWEGAIGGLVLAVAVAIAVDRLGPAAVLRKELALEIGFGLTLGIAGMLGDLAESLIKRDARQKDASQSVPGFGGVLDVIDALLFAGPVAYLWFTFTI